MHTTDPVSVGPSSRETPLSSDLLDLGGIVKDELGHLNTLKAILDPALKPVPQDAVDKCAAPFTDASPLRNAVEAIRRDVVILRQGIEELIETVEI